MYRYRLCRFLLLSLFAGVVVAAPQQAVAQEPTITFVGGGWGHGVGMSQYGAFGRASAGQTAEEILAFYYDGTTVEDRTEQIAEALGDGIRVRLSPAAGDTRPKSATIATATPGASLTVTIGEQTFTDIGSSVYLRQGQQEGGIFDADESKDSWRWVLEVDGGPDICVDCIARTPVITWTEGATVSIVDDTHGDQGTHDVGAIQLVGQDVSSTDGVFVVIQLPIDDYLHGLAEMPASWPTAALEAQAIAGRSYAVAKAIERADLSFDVYDSVSDQVYGGVPAKQPGRIAAADATSGQVIVYEDAIIRTFYTSSNGGHTAASEESFVVAEPFHIAKPDPFDEGVNGDGIAANPFPFREFTFTVSEISRWLADYPFADMNVGTVQQIIVEDLPPSRRIDDALVTIVGTDRTLEVRKTNGDPYGFRFYFAMKSGCEADYGSLSPLCPLSSNLDVISFLDIATGDFFYTPVIWMAKEQITTGKAPGIFAPNDPVTRAEAATFIWRFMGEPPPAEPSGFADVTEGIWYANAVAWMKEQGVTTGTSPTEFSPGGVVTRGQLATFLWRLAGEPIREATDQFDDVEPGKFYSEAVAWMVFHGITTGTSPTTFEPDAELTRGQLATFLWRLAGTPGAFAEIIELPEKMRP